MARVRDFLTCGCSTHDSVFPLHIVVDPDRPLERVKDSLTLKECLALPDINVVEESTNRNLLHAAVERNDIESVAVLCSRGLDEALAERGKPRVAVNWLDRSRCTPLFQAASSMSSSTLREAAIARAMVMILVKAGADTNEVCRGDDDNGGGDVEAAAAGAAAAGGVLPPDPVEPETPLARFEWVLQEIRARETARGGGSSGFADLDDDVRAQGASASSTSAAGAGAGAGAKKPRVEEIIERLVERFQVQRQDIRIVGAGDSVHVPNLLGHLMSLDLGKVFKTCLGGQELPVQGDQLASWEPLCDRLEGEFNWLDPEDKRAARNRQSKPLGRMKACLRKPRPRPRRGSGASASAQDDVMEMPYYGHYTGAVPLHKYASGPLTLADAPVAFGLCALTDAIVGQPNNHVIGTCYRSQSDHIPPHSDKYQDLVADSYISSWSFWATRSLVFTPVSGADGQEERKGFSIDLANGDFLAMGPATNAAYQHSIPPQDQVASERMSVIFRQVATHEVVKRGT